MTTYRRAKSDESPGDVSLSRIPASEAEKRGVFARALKTDLPSGVAAAGNVYNFSAVDAADGSAPTYNENIPITIMIAYDPDDADVDEADMSDMFIYHLKDVSGTDTWVKESTNVIYDTENNTIAVEVTSLSPFLAAVADDSSNDSSSSSGGSGGGSCFIDSAASGPVTPLAGMAQVAIMVTLVAAAVRVGRFTGRKLNQ